MCVGLVPYPSSLRPSAILNLHPQLQRPPPAWIDYKLSGFNPQSPIEPQEYDNSASSNCATIHTQPQHHKNFNLHFAHVSVLSCLAGLLANW